MNALRYRLRHINFRLHLPFGLTWGELLFGMAALALLLMAAFAVPAMVQALAYHNADPHRVCGFNGGNCQ